MTTLARVNPGRSIRCRKRIGRFAAQRAEIATPAEQPFSFSKDDLFGQLTQGEGRFAIIYALYSAIPEIAAQVMPLRGVPPAEPGDAAEITVIDLPLGQTSGAVGPLPRAVPTADGADR